MLIVIGLFLYIKLPLHPYPVNVRNSIAITDDKSGMLKSVVLKQKGVGEWSVKVVKEFVQLLGYKKVIMKNDNENAIMALRDEVKRESDVEIIPEQPPSYDSRASGKGEKCCSKDRRSI